MTNGCHDPKDPRTRTRSEFMTNFGLLGSTMAAAYVAGTTRRVSKEKDSGDVAHSLSVKRQVLGLLVHNDHGDVVGRIDDLILTNRAITYAIVGVGGFLGLGVHDVAIDVDNFIRANDRLVLPG